MSEEPISIPIERYLAIDAHKNYVMVGGLNARQETVLPTRRVDMEKYPQWAKDNLRPGDGVVIEATTNTWRLYDVTSPLVSKVVVAHPLEVKQIANARVKTDKHNVSCLARLLVADLVPEVWVPPLEVRELRSLIAHRQRLVKMRTMTSNRLHSVVHRNNLVPPEGAFLRRRTAAGGMRRHSRPWRSCKCSRIWVCGTSWKAGSQRLTRNWPA